MNAERARVLRAARTPPNPLDWFFYGDVMMTRNLAGHPPDDMMDQFFSDLISHSPKVIYSLSFGVVGLSSLKRKALSSILRERNLPTIVVSSDRVTRGIATALSWLGVDVNAFSWAQTDSAIAATKLPEETRAMLAEFTEIFRPMGGTD